MKRSKLRRLCKMYTTHTERMLRSRDFRKFVTRYQLQPKRKTRLSHPLRKDKIVKTKDIFSIVANYFIEFNSGKYLGYDNAMGVKTALIRGRGDSSHVMASISLKGNYLSVLRYEYYENVGDPSRHLELITEVIRKHRRYWLEVIYELPKVLPELRWDIDSKGSEYDFSDRAELIIKQMEDVNASKKTKRTN